MANTGFSAFHFLIHTGLAQADPDVHRVITHYMSPSCVASAVRPRPAFCNPADESEQVFPLPQGALVPDLEVLYEGLLQWSRTHQHRLTELRKEYAEVRLSHSVLLESISTTLGNVCLLVHGSGNHFNAGFFLSREVINTLRFRSGGQV